MALVIIEIILSIIGFFLFSFPNYFVSADNMEYTILAIGESTTANLYNGQGSWPEELEKELENRTDINFIVINEGMPGTGTAFIASNMDEMLDRYSPDMVVTMIGINDEVIGVTLKYEESLGVKTILFVKDFNLYKLGYWIFGSYEPKPSLEERYVLGDKNFAWLSWVHFINGNFTKVILFILLCNIP